MYGIKCLTIKICFFYFLNISSVLVFLVFLNCMQVNIDINLYNMHNACLWVIVLVITK